MMKTRIRSTSIFYFLQLFCPSVFLIFSCVKSDHEEVNAQQSITISNYGVLQVNFAQANELHRTTATLGSQTIEKISPSGKAFDTLRLTPGTYSVQVVPMLNAQGPIQLLDTTSTITQNAVTIISVPF